MVNNDEASVAWLKLDEYGTWTKNYLKYLTAMVFQTWFYILS